MANPANAIQVLLGEIPGLLAGLASPVTGLLDLAMFGVRLSRWVIDLLTSPVHSLQQVGEQLVGVSRRIVEAFHEAAKRFSGMFKQQGVVFEFVSDLREFLSSAGSKLEESAHHFGVEAARSAMGELFKEPSQQHAGTRRGGRPNPGTKKRTSM